VIGLKPREYYLLTPYEFWCISEGYKYKEAQESALVRKHAQVIYRVMGGEDDLSKYWPIPLIDGEPQRHLQERK
jgi:hypothetical protein